MAKCESFAFTADRFGRPVQAKITNEGLAYFSNSKILRLRPRHARRIFMEHHEEINRIAKMVCQERKDLAGELLITVSDILRLQQN
jgi:hypothetical protein